MTSNGQERYDEINTLRQPADWLQSAGDSAEQKADARLLRLFNHYRHDWMNDIQLLMGYVQLKKYDKLPGLMEKIKQKVRQEGFVSKLGIPSLIVYLIAFQSEVKELKLEVSLSEELHLQHLQQADQMAHTLTTLLELQKLAARGAGEELGELALELTRDGRWLQVRVECRAVFAGGMLQEQEASLEHLCVSGGGEWLGGSGEEQRRVWGFRWPFKDGAGTGFAE